MSFWGSIFTIIAVLVAFWFFVVWLPHRRRLSKLSREYGSIAEKQAKIERLFKDRVIALVSYTGGSLDPNEEFTLLISGSFGTFMRTGIGDRIKTAEGSALLPQEVLEAFSGYMDSVSGTVELLWDLPFFQRLKELSNKQIKIDGDPPGSLVIAW